MLLPKIAKCLSIGSVSDNFLTDWKLHSDSEKETLNMIVDTIQKFLSSKEADFKEYDEKGEQPKSYIDELKNLGLFGLIIPEEFGGLGLSSAGYARTLEEVAKYDGSTALTIGAHSSIGMKGILLFGNLEQKKKYLPKLSSGETIAAFCLTESGSGSDAASIKTKAELQPDGSWILNGEKIWITNGPIADIFTVFARTDSKDGSMSAFIVERIEGLSHGKKENKLGIRASATSTVSFNNLKLRADQLLGEPGQGFKIAMAILNNGRTGLGGGCVGAMKRSLKLAENHASERKQFGKSIREFGLIKEKLAQMKVDIYATESIVGTVCKLIDRDSDDYSIEAAISKVFATEKLWNVSNEALQVAGGTGYMKEYAYEMIIRDARINLIFEGTNEVLRLYIGLTTLKHVGDYLKNVAKSFSNPVKYFKSLADYISKKIFESSTIARCNLNKIGKIFPDEIEGLLRDIAEISKVSEHLIKKYRKNIINEQLHVKRFADCLIDTAVSLTTLGKATSDKNEVSINLAKMFCKQARRRVNMNLRRINLSNEDQLIESV